MLDFAVKSSDVRSHFSEYLDSVVRKAPTVVHRRNDRIVMMNFEHLSAFVEDLQLNATVERDDSGGYNASLVEIEDIIATGETVEDSLLSLAEELIDYSQEYLTDNFVLYFNSPNRKRHFPYVIKVLMQDSPEEVLSFLRVQS